VAIAVLDASFVIALFDANDPHHSRAVAVLSEQRDRHKVLPASAYAECLVGPLRRGQKAAETIERAIAEHALEVVPIDRALAHRAAEIRSRHATVGLPDALVLATGETLDADVVLTADRSWTRYSKRAQVI
jgi:predicted nucleic acid-binding protein